MQLAVSAISALSGAAGSLWLTRNLRFPQMCVAAKRKKLRPKDVLRMHVMLMMYKVSS